MSALGQIGYPPYLRICKVWPISHLTNITPVCRYLYNKIWTIYDPARRDIPPEYTQPNYYCRLIQTWPVQSIGLLELFALRLELSIFGQVGWCTQSVKSYILVQAGRPRSAITWDRPGRWWIYRHRGGEARILSARDSAKIICAIVEKAEKSANWARLNGQVLRRNKVQELTRSSQIGYCRWNTGNASHL